MTLSAHGNKVQLVKWHPLAKDILISMAFDQSVKIWNLNDPAQPQMELEVRICVFFRVVVFIESIKLFINKRFMLEQLDE